MNIQLAFEHKTSAQSMARELDCYTDEVLGVVVPLVRHYINMEPEDAEYLHEVWEQREELDYEETVWELFAYVAIAGRATVQQLLGIFWHRLDCEHGSRKAKVMEPFFLALQIAPHIKFEKRGTEFVYTCDLKIDKGDYGYILPRLTPTVVTKNSDMGYESVKQHVITGGKLKQHNEEICLDHLNRLNSISYSVEQRLPLLHTPTPNTELKLKSSGEYESPREMALRVGAWCKFHDELPARIQLLNEQGNQFHVLHRYDTRLRTYVKGYHLDYVGNKHARAIVQLTAKEVVEGY